MYYIEAQVLSGQTDFSRRECKATIQSAYRSNRAQSGTATFDRDVLVNKQTKAEVELELPEHIFDESIRPADIVYANDVKESAWKLYYEGYDQVDPIGVPHIDKLYKMKRGELTLLSGIGNSGKSQIEKWFLLMHAMLYNRKFCLFAPEDNPAEEFYNDMLEIVLAAECAFNKDFPNKRRPSIDTYARAYEWVNEHFFFISPETTSPTPEYIRERFLEMIIKEKVDGCIIDPWNQLTNRYNLHDGREDKYLEVQLAEFKRFALMNNIFMLIISHPKNLAKKGDDYPCPDVFDLAGGAMWNNKCDNILVYHRPTNVSDPSNRACEFHSKKIKKQKVVGKKGWNEFEFDLPTRRYIFENEDPMRKWMKSRPDWAWALWDRVPSSQPETPPPVLSTRSIDTLLQGFEPAGKYELTEGVVDPNEPPF